jgi:hypothetical protein
MAGGCDIGTRSSEPPTHPRSFAYAVTLMAVPKLLTAIAVSIFIVAGVWAAWRFGGRRQLHRPRGVDIRPRSVVAERDRLPAVAPLFWRRHGSTRHRDVPRAL